MNVPKNRLARDVSAYSLRLSDNQWVANHDGNVSARNGQRFAITPTGLSKRDCTPETIVECTLDGKPVGRGRPPSEVALHVGIYAARSDVQAVLHAHPPYASAFALAQRALDPVAMPEVLVSLGEHIPMMSMVLPKAPEAAEMAGRVVAYADVALLAGNGAISVGPDLETAYLRMELLEHYCRILAVLDAGVGKPAPLSGPQREYLLNLRKKAGLHREVPAAEAQASRTAQPGLREVVAEEIRRALGDSK